MTTLLWILVSLAAICTISLVTVLLVVRTIYRRIRRSRTLNGVALRTRAGLSWGPQRKVLALRVKLADSLDSGRAALDLSGRRDGLSGELPRLYRRIQAESDVLDAHLRLMETETDASELAQQLPEATRRVTHVTELVGRLRGAVTADLTGLADDSLSTLRTDVDREVAALHAGVQEMRTLRRFDTYADPIRPPSTDSITPSR